MWTRNFIALLLFPLCAWGVIIPTERAIPGQMWTNAGLTAIGGIPTNQTMFTNFTSSVTLAQLNAALAACPSNQYVFLTNGTYNFNGTVSFGQTTGVVLRGNGESNTILNFDSVAGGNNVMIGEETINRVDPGAGNIVNWTNGFTQGTNVIYLEDVSDMVVGKIIALDQLNNNTWVDDDIQEGCSYCGRAAGERAQCQYVRVEAVNGNAVTISPGLYMMNWATNYTPQAFYWPESDTTMCGVESLSITSSVNSGIYSIYISQAQNCWVKNVSFYGIRTAAFATSQCKNIEVRKIRMLSNDASGSQSYGVIWYMCSDGLMIDSIAANITGSMNYSPQAQGCVVAYNFITNNIYTPSNWDIAALASHDAHVCMNLTEGNWCNKVFYDSIHGSASHNTDLRNVYHGKQVQGENNTIAYAAQQFVRSNNVVGNILGTSNYHTWYIVDSQTEFDNYFSSAIFRLGEGNAGDGIPFDTVVAPSTLIHGNYNSVSNAILWDAGIADVAIPNSYFLSAKPSWFGDRTWPPFNPSNVTAAATSPTNLPAGYRYYFGSDPPAGGGSSGNRSATVSGTFRAY